MNWTEGNLARHSRGRQNKVALRQKEHFAKARLGLLNGSKKSPPAISLPDQPSSHPLAATHHEKLDRLSGAAHVRHSSCSSPGPLASRKRPRTPSVPGQSSRPRHSSAAAAATSNAPAFSPFFATETSPFFPPSEGHDGSNGSKRVRLDRDDATVEDLALRKQRLLVKADWAGVGFQKPIKVQFSRVTSGPEVWSKARASSSRRARHLVGERYDEASSRDRRSESGLERRGDKLPGARPHDIRIRVGSMEKRLGESPSLASGTRSGRRISAEQLSPISSSTSSGVLQLSQQAKDLESQYKASSSRSENEKPAHRAGHILGLSSSGIYQPEPRRPPPTWLLPRNYPPSGATGSLIARVGKHKAPVTASLREEDEMWKACVGVGLSSSSNIGIDSNMGMDGSRHAPERPRISPGISEWQPQVGSNATESVRASELPSSGLPSHAAKGETAELLATVEHTGEELSAANTAQSQNADQLDGLHPFLSESEIRSVLPRDEYPQNLSDSGSLPTLPSDKSEKTRVSTSPGPQHSPVQLSTQSETAAHDSHADNDETSPLMSDLSNSAVGQDVGLQDIKSTGPQGPVAIQLWSTTDKRAPGLDQEIRGTASHPAMSEEEKFEQIWRKYLFGNNDSYDSDDIKNKAFAEAITDVAKELRPSPSARGRDEDPSTDSLYSDELSWRGTAGVSTYPSNELSGFRKDHVSGSRCPPHSHVATVASSSGEVIARSSSPIVPFSVTAYGPSLPSSPAQVPSTQPPDSSHDGSTQAGRPRAGMASETRANATTGGQDTSRGRILAGTVVPRTAAGHSSRLASRPFDELFAPPVDQARLVSASSRQVGEEERVAARYPMAQAPQPRFVPPKSFVGKLSTSKTAGDPPGGGAVEPLSLHEKTKKRGPGRPKKRVQDGRADIRALPNYSGDPIEEIEEDDGGPPSRFGALDME